MNVDCVIKILFKDLKDVFFYGLMCIFKLTNINLYLKIIFPFSGFLTNTSGIRITLIFKQV